MTVIEDYAFADCENLEVIYLSVNTETIGAYAFLNCKKMTSILLPSSIKSIGEGAFKNCISLESVIFPEYITTIENECFEGCTSLVVLIIPGYVESIGYRSFADCDNLKEVQLTGAINSISDEAFYNCNALMNTYIPEYVESIGVNAFFNVKHVIYDGTATGSPWGALKRSYKPKRDYVTGKNVYENLKRIDSGKVSYTDVIEELKLKYMSPMNRIREKKTYLMKLDEHLEELMKQSLLEKRHSLALYIEKMKGLSPLQKLNSGFSYVTDAEGKNIRSVQHVEEGKTLKIQVTDGHMDTIVTGVEEENL